MIFLGEGVVLPDAAADLPPSFQALTRLPLVILVGVTGVGKSTALTELASAGCRFSLLPDRRLVADQVIIASLQRQDGLPVQAVKDRRERFQYTARYRRLFPGGMARALTRLWVDPDTLAQPLIFDGLRGLEEVQHAAEFVPGSRFVVLDAPDIVRVHRLLERGDTFDAASISSAAAPRGLLDALHQIPNLHLVFDLQQLRAIGSLAAAGSKDVPVEDVVKKVAIIVEERRNYDPQAAKTFLRQNLPPERCLSIDTEIYSPRAVAEQIARWL